jgi:uncharacterized membrane protein YraQ (UPF0718 family)
MGDRVTIASALNFEELIPYDKDLQLHKRIIISTINWLYTNYQGMSFGLLLATLLLSLLQGLHFKLRGNIIFEAISGSLIGAPLGVCVNCATPIGLGLITSRQSLITSFSTIIASPTLNFIVLTLSFKLFPWNFALLKLSFSLLYILVIMPVIIRMITGPPKKVPSIDHQVTLISYKETWILVGKSIWSNLIYMTKKALPLMIIAGFLGSVLIEIFPLEQLSHFTLSFKSLLLTALIGTLLPAPMAFDVVVTFLLFKMGLPLELCFTLFFSLGIFSLYPFLIILRNHGGKIAASLLASIIITAIIGGYSFYHMNQFLLKATTHTYKGHFHNELMRVIEKSCKKHFPKESKKCISTQIQEQSKSASDESLCHYLESPSLKEQCQYQVALELIANHRDKSLCYKLKQYKKPCLDSFDHTRPLFEKMQKNFCKEIKNLQERLSCLAEIKKNIEASFNQKWCSYLENTSLIQSCIFQITLKLIKRGGNPDLCYDLPHQKLIQSCLLESEYQKVIREMRVQKKNLCFKIKHQDNKIRCEKVVISHKASSNQLSPADCEQMKYTRYFCLKQFISRPKNTKSCDAPTCQKNPIEGVRSDIFLLRSKYLGDQTRKNKILKTLPPDPAKIPFSEKGLVFQSKNYKVYKRALNKKKLSLNNTFEKIEGDKIGLDFPLSYLPQTRYEPFAHSLGISSGDFNNDQWPDLLVPWNDKILIYKNNGGTFKKSILNIPGKSPIILVAFVDIDNDGYQDIFFSRWKKPAGFILNKRGTLAPLVITYLPHTQSLIPMAASFGDLNGDERLDFYLGNWSFGTFASEHAPFKNSQNLLLINKKSGFIKESLPVNFAGETLGVLISDINNDGRADILEANDFGLPDLYLLNTPYGLINKAKWPPLSPTNSMGIDTADINGDLQLDIFSVDLDFAQQTPLLQINYCQFIKNQKHRNQCQKNLHLRSAVNRRNPQACMKHQESSHFCLGQILTELAFDFNQKIYCKKIPSAFFLLKSLCADRFVTLDKKAHFQTTYLSPQIARNILLLGGHELRDVTTEMKVQNSGWSWNAKFADLDNDGWMYGYLCGQRISHQRPCDLQCFF